MSIRPVNTSTISQAIVDALKQDNRFADVPVTRGEDNTLSPDNCPWIGVYRISTEYPQRLLTSDAGFRGQRVRFLILVTDSNLGSGEACEDSIEKHVTNILSVLMSDTALRGVVNMLDGFAVDYTTYTRDGQYYMQTAAIQFVAITNTVLGG